MLEANKAALKGGVSDPSFLMIRALVDWENNSEAFWDEFHARFPSRG